MTLDEISVKISVAADEALATIEKLSQKVLEMSGKVDRVHTVQVDSKQAEEQLELLSREADAFGENLKERSAGVMDELGRLFDQGLTEMAQRGIEVPESLANGMLQMLTDAIETSGADDFGALEEGVRAAVSGMCEAMEGPELQQAVETMMGYITAAREGLYPDDEEVERFQETWNMLFGEDSPMLLALSQIPGISEEAAQGLIATGVEMEGLGESWQSAMEMLSAGEEAIGSYDETIQQLGDEVARLDRSVGNIRGIQKNIDAYKDARKAYDDARKSGKNAGDAFDGVQKSAKQLGIQLDKGTGSVKDMDKAMGRADTAVDALEQGVQKDGQQIVGTLQGLLLQALKTEEGLNVQAAMGVDVSQPLAAIAMVIALIGKLLGFMGAAGIKPAGGGGGGGDGGRGGGGSEAVDNSEWEAEEAARKAEEARKEAIRQDYDRIEHKRHMNEITMEEELEMLEKLRKAHQLNAEEIMDWEEKIYDLKQEIRERDAESIDTLSDGVVSALEARYEAMRDAELERLDASREAWEQWRDDSVQAINDQIDALEKLSDTEDREKKDAEELRKIEKLRREIEYEQDDYNRMKLQQQLEKAMDDREERLRKLALQDQKAALREEIDRIDQKADDEISALDKEQDAIEAAYEERLKQAALNAEAEKLLLGQNQQEIMELLNEYVPEYNALGQSMGEKLLDGFKSKVGDVVAWFKEFNDGIIAMQEQFAATSNAAAESFYNSYAGRVNSTAPEAAGVTVNQTVTFNEPVESPSQVARRMEDVNDALGALLG